MTPERPRVAPGLLAEITAAAPKRIVRKVDAKPTLADDWDWRTDGARTTVQVSEDVCVKLDARDGVLRDDGDVSCSCLLAPRCLHLLAVLGRLEIDGASGGEGADAEQGGQAAENHPPGYQVAEQASVEAVALDGGKREAAQLLWKTAAKLLDGGAMSAGAVQQAELLRAGHTCRAAGLHRAASAALRVVRGVRDLREERPQFSLEGLTADLLEALHVAARLVTAAERDDAATVATVWCGTARRVYRPIGGLKLSGLLCEAVIAATGYRGVATYLCDGDGRMFCVVDVVPADLQRAHGTYDQVTRLAESGLSHRQLCREGLFVQGATASDDGRLGAGSSVKAVRAGTVRWTDEGLAAMWQVPLSQQVARAYAAAALPAQVRPAGSDLLLLSGAVLGAHGASLVVLVDGRPLSCQAPSDHAELAASHNLELLARAPGLPLWLVGRLRMDQPYVVSLLAVGPAPAGDAESELQLCLPEDWHGRCNVGLDKLQGPHLRGALLPTPAGTPLPASEVPDALAALRRRLFRLALGGRVTLPPEAARSIEQEALRMERRMLRSGAAALRALGAAALARRRDLSGAREPGAPTELARAFVASGLFERGARLQLQRLGWLD